MPSTRVPKSVTIDVSAEISVSALLERPPRALACVVLAHGAGAGMHHPFLAAFSEELSKRRLACLRFQFPSMERGSRRPDRPELCHATIRAAVTQATRLTRLPLIAGGKSFGGRMTSQAQALIPLPNVRGLAFVGFPLHPPERPSADRAEHLSNVQVPTLFLQGSRDEFAELKLLRRLIKRLGKRATLHLVPDADHSFHVPARSGKTDAMVMAELAEALSSWAVNL